MVLPVGTEHCKKPEERWVGLPSRFMLPQPWGYEERVPGQHGWRVGIEAKGLTESFSLLEHEDRRVHGKGAGYFKMEILRSHSDRS